LKFILQSLSFLNVVLLSSFLRAPFRNTELRCELKIVKT
jgi:hypothetical protein